MAAGNPAEVDVAALASAGHYLAIRVAFHYPMIEVNAWPRAWVRAYVEGGLMIEDPVFRWALTEVGHRRWSALGAARGPGGRDVLGLAAAHGLRFGLAVSVLEAGQGQQGQGQQGHGQGRQRSWGSFARPDREFTDAECACLAAHVRARHAAHVPPPNVTRAEIDALRLLKDGQRLKQIAWELRITEGAVKQRLKSARAKLEVRTGAEAISRASTLGMI